VSTAALDRLLAVLLAAIGLTGLASLWAGSPRWGWLFVLHGLLGGALLAASLVKLRRSLPAIRRRSAGRGATTLLFTALALASVLVGFAAVASGRIVVGGPWTLISWHAVIGLAAVPLLAIHLVPRRWRVLEPRHALARRLPGRALTRRAMLVAGGLALAGIAARGAAEGLDRAFGGTRRFTGSRPLTAGGPPPPTTFLGESTAPIDPTAWRLHVGGKVEEPATFSLAELTALGTETRRAVLDCTSGWVHEGDWTGVSLATILARVRPLPGSSRVTVRAVTGWAAAFALDDSDGALLATAVAGEPLAHGNGAPCRLVLEDHRGLEWVKWADRIEVS
jgi:hypothetical protein